MKPCGFTVRWSDKINYGEINSKFIPKSIGVYEIQGHISADNKYTRRYVGMSDDLNRRFSEHLLNSEPNTNLREFISTKKVFFRYVTTETEDIAKDIEKGLYDKYKHTYNDPEHPPNGSGKCSTIQITEENV